MLTCSSCGNEEPDGSRFCGSCGALFAPVEPPVVDPAPSSGAMLACASCGNEEPEGTRFCGGCGASFVALEPETPSSATAEEPVPILAATEPGGTGRIRWVAAAVAVGLLLAGGAVAGVLTLTGDDDETVAESTEQPSFPETTTESFPPEASQTLADTIRPRFVELVGYQAVLSARVRQLQAGVESFAALRQAAALLDASVVEAQDVANGFAPADGSEASALLFLNSALADHLAYANAISRFPARPRFFTKAAAQEAIARAERAQIAYTRLAAAEPSLSGISLSSSDHARLLTLVPSATPPPAATTRRVIDLVPLLVGIRPDDALGEGRCFGPYPGASLSVSGVVHRSGFIQCGDDADGDPSRASGTFHFAGPTFPVGSKLARITGQVVIDEFSAPSQRGSSVTWAVFYEGAQICSAAVTWNGSRPAPGTLDCRFPSGVALAGRFDVRRLRVQQDASLVSAGAFWAGLLRPTIVVEVPR
jgi:hypothetical protein